MSEAELKRLAHSEYWDERYAEVGPNEQVHEWFKSYNDLAPFFSRHLFQIREPRTAPKILHLGSGDSVSSLNLRLLARLQRPNSGADNTRRPFETGL